MHAVHIEKEALQLHLGLMDWLSSQLRRLTTEAALKTTNKAITAQIMREQIERVMVMASNDVREKNPPWLLDLDLEHRVE